MPRPSSFRPEVRRALPLLVALRFVTSTAGRMVFSYIPIISRGTGLSIEQMGVVLSLRDMTGLLATSVGRGADRFGRGKSIFWGSIVLGLGLILASLGAVGVLVGLVIYGIGRLGLHIGMNAWVADEVAYERRGQAIGLIELTWAGSLLIGIPICGVLIDQLGWQAPFVLLGGLTLVLALAQRNRFDDQATTASETPAERDPIRSWMDSNVAATLLGPALLGAGAQFIFFGHGSWLEEEFGFNATKIGSAALTLGAAEVLGSWGSSLFADPLGKRNAVAIGGTVMIAAMFGLIVVASPSLVVGLGLLIVLFLGFEFAIVSSLSLTAELRPQARARIIGLSVGVSTVVKALVALAAGWLDQRYAFQTLAIAGAGCTVVALTLVFIGIREPGDPAPVVSPGRRGAR